MVRLGGLDFTQVSGWGAGQIHQRGQRSLGLAIGIPPGALGRDHCDVEQDQALEPAPFGGVINSEVLRHHLAGVCRRITP